MCNKMYKKEFIGCFSIKDYILVNLEFKYRKKYSHILKSYTDAILLRSLTDENNSLH